MFAHRSLVLAVTLLLVAVPGARASMAGIQGGTLLVTGDGGERNRIDVSVSGSSLRVSDTGATLRPGAECTKSRRDVLCPAAGLTEIVADAGDRDDRLTVARSVTLRSRLRGGTGDDTLVGGGGADELDGGTGRDAVSYSAAPGAVSVTLAGGADDGLAGEGDNVLATETVVGSAFSDALSGGEGGERLEGGGGDDRVDGGAGNDRIYGGQGQDAVSGGAGNDALVSSTGDDGRDVLAGGPGTDLADYAPRSGSVVADPDGRADDGGRDGVTLTATGPVSAIALLSSPEADNLLPDVESLRGGRGDDVIAAGARGGRLTGGGGTDVLVGGPGPDRFDGSSGFDRILARDRHAEQVACGSQIDRVYTAGGDRLGTDCERTSTSFAVTLAPARRTMADGVAAVRVTCPAQAAVRCVGAVRLVTVRRLRARAGRARPATLGAARFNVPTGTALDVDVRLTATGRAALDRLGGATRVRAGARGRDEAGPARPAATRFILRAP